MNKKMTILGLILMIFTSVFGFSNGPIAFYLMGYGSIVWYVLAAFLFFIPYALMMAEFGSAYKNESGGIYTWMKDALGERLSFIGTFMWFASYIIWMVSVAPKIWITLSTFLSASGSDQTQKWHFFALNSTQVIGLLSIGWMVVLTFVSSRGMKQIIKITSIGGLAVGVLNVVLLLTSSIILIKNHGQFAQPPTHLFSSPNPTYQSQMQVLSFIVFAIFAYGGIEAVGSLVEKTDKPEKNFPKGILLAAVTIALGYAIGIACWGISTNWQAVLNHRTTNLGNITYVMMNNLGVQLGQALGLDASQSTTIGAYFARYTGLSMFLAYTGGFFTLAYSPLKSVITGTPKEIWSKKMTQLNKVGMPQNAMWAQFAIVTAIILLSSFISKDPSDFYNKLTLMSNVSLTLPSVFLVIAFPLFKKNQTIKKEFEVFTSPFSINLVSIIVFLVVFGANFFTVFAPIFEHGQAGVGDTLWMICGPIFFSLCAWFLFNRYANHHLSQTEEGLKEK